MQFFTSKIDIQQRISTWRASGQVVAFVPTMGNLHDGHLSLLDTAYAQADKVVVSIYVNPSQFSANEDFDSYPRTHQEDLEKLKQSGKCHAVYSPSEMYTDTHATYLHPAGVALGLEAVSRPHFFSGVATIVLKLFNHVPAHKAVFGEKDYQQLMVIKQMVDDLDIDIDILPSPTIRDKDGLALSSRNGYLSAAERQIAPYLHQILAAAADDIRAGKEVTPILQDAQDKLKQAGFDHIDYFSYCSQADLSPLTSFSSSSILLASARLSSTRLIDNFLLR